MCSSSGEIEIDNLASLPVMPDKRARELAERMSGNLCRCATYDRIRGAISDAAAKLRGEGE